LCGCVATVRGGRSVQSGWSCTRAWLALQGYGAALGVVQRHDGDGDGAGQGGRACGLSGQRRVQFWGLRPRVVGFSQCGADGPSTRGGSARSGCFGCAGSRRCTMRRPEATRRRRWRWSRRARTCTARPTTGTVSRGCILVSLCCRSAGRTVCPLGGGAAGVPASAVQEDGTAHCGI
jgi:hypothetical protein